MFNTAAALPPPTILKVTGMTTSIKLLWDQPEDSTDAVEGYEIYYNFTINQCLVITRQNMQGSISVGRMTTYTLVDSASTPIEEDSTYFITVTAINQVTNSTSLVQSVVTSTAGWYAVYINYA